MNKPTAWYVIRNVPGKPDHGVRYGPFFKESDADEWTDENHIKIPLYEHTEQDRLDLTESIYDAVTDKWMMLWNGRLDPTTEEYGKLRTMISEVVQKIVK